MQRNNSELLQPVRRSFQKSNGRFEDHTQDDVPYDSRSKEDTAPMSLKVKCLILVLILLATIALAYFGFDVSIP